MRVAYVAPRFHTNQVPIIKGWVEDGDEVITETSKDGFMTTNLKEKGTHYYSYNKFNDTYDMVAERIEVEGENAYAHFYNGGDL